MSATKKGRPLTDPYPFRSVSTWPPQEKKEADCDYVALDKKYAKTANVEEMGDYTYIMKPAWQHINELTQKNKDLEEHIQWLNNVGGERLNMACGIDIMCRDMVLAKKVKPK